MTDEYFWISSEIKSGVTKHFLVETVSEYDRKNYKYTDEQIKKIQVPPYYVEERERIEKELKDALALLEQKTVSKYDNSQLIRSVTISRLVAEINKTLKEIDQRYQNTNPQLIEMSEARFGEVLAKYFNDLKNRCLSLNDI
jgi:hypothetical protein